MSSQIESKNSIGNILATARRYLTQNGQADFTMDQLADACGISRATLYRRIGGREALLTRLATEQGIEIEELDSPGIKVRILQATRTALSQSGSLNFTVEQVADLANVGVATVYRHFGSKTALLEGLSDQIHPRRAALNLLDEPTDNLEKDLHNFAVKALRFMSANRDLASFYFTSNTDLRDIFQALRGDHNRTIDTLSTYLQEKIDIGEIPSANPFDLAIAFMGMIVGFSFIKPSYTDEIDEPEITAAQVTKIFINGICSKDPS